MVGRTYTRNSTQYWETAFESHLKKVCKICNSQLPKRVPASKGLKRIWKDSLYIQRTCVQLYHGRYSQCFVMEHITTKNKNKTKTKKTIINEIQFVHVNMKGCRNKDNYNTVWICEFLRVQTRRPASDDEVTSNW